MCDTGPGIDDATQSKMFEPFYTSKAVGQGTGLGLSVVHGVAHGHDGHIIVDGSPGRTTISSYLPTGGVRRKNKRETRCRQPPRLARLGSLQGRVLLVDDEDSVRRVTAQLLEKRGLGVTAVASAADALVEFRVAPMSFDLVITDQTMPDVSGFDLAAQLLALRPGLPVILCSGYSHEIDAKRAREAGIRAYFEKPVDFPKLVERISELLTQAAA